MAVLVSWFSQVQLFELLMSPEYLHTELLKRNDCIPTFLLDQDALSDSQLMVVWKAAVSSSHESIRHGVYKLLQSIASKADASKMKVRGAPLSRLTQRPPPTTRSGRDERASARTTDGASNLLLLRANDLFSCPRFARPRTPSSRARQPPLLLSSLRSPPNNLFARPRTPLFCARPRTSPSLALAPPPNPPLP